MSDDEPKDIPDPIEGRMAKHIENHSKNREKGVPKALRMYQEGKKFGILESEKQLIAIIFDLYKSDLITSFDSYSERDGNDSVPAIMRRRNYTQLEPRTVFRLDQERFIFDMVPRPSPVADLPGDFENFVRVHQADYHIELAPGESAFEAISRTVLAIAEKAVSDRNAVNQSASPEAAEIAKSTHHRLGRDTCGERTFVFTLSGKVQEILHELNVGMNPGVVIPQRPGNYRV